MKLKTEQSNVCEKGTEGEKRKKRIPVNCKTTSNILVYIKFGLQRGREQKIFEEIRSKIF